MSETREQCWQRIHSSRKREEIRRAEEARRKIIYHKGALRYWEKELMVAEDELRALSKSKVEP